MLMDNVINMTCKLQEYVTKVHIANRKVCSGWGQGLKLIMEPRSFSDLAEATTQPWGLLYDLETLAT